MKLSNETRFFRYSMSRYSLWRPGKHEGFLNFSWDGESPFQQALFLTPDFYDSAHVARDYLALTHLPQWRLLGSVRSSDPSHANAELVSSHGAANTPSRVWPAFGRHGGGWEIILSDGYFVAPKASPLADGGAFDEWKASGAMAGSLRRLAAERIQALARDLWQVLGKQVGWEGQNSAVAGDSERRVVAIKITEFGVALRWVLDDRCYCVSCGELADMQNDPVLQFWAYVWRDHEDIGVRELWGPAVRTGRKADGGIAQALTELVEQVGKWAHQSAPDQEIGLPAPPSALTLDFLSLCLELLRAHGS